jgi:enamine deaminase RidA (YjgF/YER057c/UK114 family)
MPRLPRPIAVPGLHPGVPYHYAVTTAAAELVFTAGACPLDASGRVCAPGDLEEQTRATLDNLAATLAAAAAGLEQIVKLTVLVASADRSDLVRAWDVVAARLGEPCPPSTLVGVAALGYAGQLVEIEAVALTG